jgi:hypothetical protein
MFIGQSPCFCGQHAIAKKSALEGNPVKTLWFSCEVAGFAHIPCETD